MNRIKNGRLATILGVMACLLMLPLTASAQLPTPTIGWNLGDTMEAPSGPGTWGPLPTQALINAVAKAGFNTIRIPCAWYCNSNSSGVINPTYMAQVQQVVNWCVADNLYVIINDHWDNGWFEDCGFASFNSTTNSELQTMWSQVATAFSGYNNQVLFACANEPNASTAAQSAVLFQYYETFIQTVRATGGNNTNRWLLLEGPGGANINDTNSWVTTLPADPTSGRLMMEVHEYDPSQFTIITSDQSWGNMFYFWGQGYHSTSLTSRNATWGEEQSWLVPQFDLMYNQFISKGIPVLVGEFRAAPKPSGEPGLTGSLVTLNYDSTTYWDKCVVDCAHSYHLSCTCWDTPGTLFNWTTGAVIDQNTINALTGGASIPPAGGDGAQYCFELSSEAWAGGGAPITGVATSTTQKFAGAQSLAVTFNGSAGTSSAYVIAPWCPAGKTVTFHVWIPKGSKISAIQPYVQDQNWTWTGNYQAIGSLKTNAWNTITVAVPSNAVTPLQGFGVQFSTSATWSGTCYINSVGW